MNLHLLKGYWLEGHTKSLVVWYVKIPLQELIPRSTTVVPIRILVRILQLVLLRQGLQKSKVAIDRK